jgi:hypothetical protein
MKKERFNKLRALKKERENLFKKIKAEAEKQYPIDTEVLFKRGRMVEYGIGIVNDIRMYHGSIELVITNIKTGKRYCLSTYYLHKDYK